MTKIEAEKLFMDAVEIDEKVTLDMTAKETLTFRTLIGRVLKEMSKRQPKLYANAKNFTIERENGYTVIKRADVGRFNARVVKEDGTVVLVRSKERAEDEIDDLGSMKVEVMVAELKDTVNNTNCKNCVNKVCSLKQNFMRECDKTELDTLYELTKKVCDNWNTDKSTLNEKGELR